MNEDKNSKKSNFEKFSEMALNKGKSALDDLFERAKAEIESGKERVRIKKPEKPKDESRVKFVRNVRPIKTYANANRKVSLWQEKKHNKDVSKKFFVDPANDGLVSFTLLLGPFAFFMGLLYALDIFTSKLGIVALLLLYVIFIAIPGAYLGVNSIIATGKMAIYGGKETVKFILEVVYLFIAGLWELVFLFISGLWNFVGSYWAFTITYVLSCILLFFGVRSIWPDINIDYLSFGFFLLILLPSLFPASLVHRQWQIYEYKHKSNS